MKTEKSFIMGEGGGGPKSYGKCHGFNFFKHFSTGCKRREMYLPFGYILVLMEDIFLCQSFHSIGEFI